MCPLMVARVRLMFVCVGYDACRVIFFSVFMCVSLCVRVFAAVVYVYCCCCYVSFL